MYKLRKTTVHLEEYGKRTVNHWRKRKSQLIWSLRAWSTRMASYLGVICGLGAEEGFQRVVAGNEEASEVGEESTANVEEH